MTTKDYAPMTTEQQAPSFSFLGSFAGFAAIGGAVVAAIAFGGPHLAKVLETSANADGASEFWKKTAETVGGWASSASSGLETAGGYLTDNLHLENIGLKDAMGRKTAAAVAGAIGLGLGGSLISGAAHSGNTTIPHAAAHAAIHTLGHTTP